MSKAKEKKLAEEKAKMDKVDKEDTMDEILQEDQVCGEEVESVGQLEIEEEECPRKVKILPTKKDSSASGVAGVKRPKRKIRGKRAEYTVKECGMHAKKKFGVSSEVFFIATREAGKEDLDLITLKEGERILIDFMKREVK